MSLPWKKNKSSRISRFLSEYQKSPKRGGSLIVETGFPVSLIDLFFKNRDRLKKSPSKRFQRLERQIQTAPNASSLINQDAILEKSQRKEAVGSKIEKVNFIRSGLKAEKKRVNQNSDCVCVYGRGGSGVCVLLAFQVFIVAMLALSAKKKLTTGITLSAFALLLTEFVAARMFTRSKLCKTNKDKNAISREKIETFNDSRECCGEEETQIPKSQTKSISCLEETEPEVAVTENSNSNDLKIRDLLLKDEKSRSKSSSLKSKIVKKLRSYKKSKKTMNIKEETLTQVSSLVSEDKSETNESKKDEVKSNPPLKGSKGDKTNGIALIVIVLTSLLCGKILAIILTLSCLVLRFGVGKKSDLCI